MEATEKERQVRVALERLHAHHGDRALILAHDCVVSRMPVYDSKLQEVFRRLFGDNMAKTGRGGLLFRKETAEIVRRIIVCTPGHDGMDRYELAEEGPQPHIG